MIVRSCVENSSRFKLPIFKAARSKQCNEIVVFSRTLAARTTFCRPERHFSRSNSPPALLKRILETSTISQTSTPEQYKSTTTIRPTRTRSRKPQDLYNSHLPSQLCACISPHLWNWFGTFRRPYSTIVHKSHKVYRCSPRMWELAEAVAESRMVQRLDRCVLNSMELMQVLKAGSVLLLLMRVHNTETGRG